MLYFYEILLHTYKFLLRKVCHKTRYFTLRPEERRWKVDKIFCASTSKKIPAKS